MATNGDTSWQHTPLVTAALNGHLCVLDGMHRLHHSTAMVLQRLVGERELELFDGTRLLPKEKFDAICTKTGLTAHQLEERYVCLLVLLTIKANRLYSSIYAIHPDFRLAMLAEPPNLHEASQHWLTAELIAMGEPRALLSPK